MDSAERVPETAATSRSADAPFLRACRGEPVSSTPVWLMRQAGRYQPSYRRLREKHSFLELCKNPELAAQVTLEAVREIKADAAILFADLLPILEPLGLKLEYLRGDGPVIHNPIRTAADVDRLAEVDVRASLPFVFEAVRMVRAALPGDVPLIGFAGAPFTLAAYAIEGRASRSFHETKTFMYRDPGAWHALLERLARAVISYLDGQIQAGVQAVQLFDSWVGCLGPEDYRKFVLDHSRAVLQALDGRVPRIHFAVGCTSLLGLMAEAGGDVIGLDWRVPLAETWDRLGARSVQGNLDPCVLLADRSVLEARVHRLLQSVRGRPGHIFNLGHGVLPNTPVDNVKALVDAVHCFSPES